MRAPACPLAKGLGRSLQSLLHKIVVVVVSVVMPTPTVSFMRPPFAAPAVSQVRGRPLVPARRRACCRLWVPDERAQEQDYSIIHKRTKERPPAPSP